MKVACLWFDEKVNTNKVAENCMRFSPQICTRDQEAVFIEIGKCEKIYSEASFLARVQVILKRLQLTASIGIGNNISESLLKAKYRTQCIDQLPLSALIFLADPFNRDLVIQKYVQKMILAFTDLGIKNLQQFKTIPTSELVSRFGAVGILCRQRVMAETQIPWPHWRPEEIIAEKSLFPHFSFYGELETLLFELKKQLDHIFQRLWSRGLKAQTMQVKVFVETNSLHTNPFRKFEFDFMFPQSTTKMTLSIIRERLTRDFERSPVQTPLMGLETLILNAVPSTSGQRSLLHNNEDKAEQLFSLLNQLAETCGAKNIFQAELTEERRPERSWQKTNSFVQKKEVRVRDHVPNRPTYLLRPELIQITAGYLYIRKKPYQIIKWSENVERITGGWIEDDTDLNNSFDRNYYTIHLIDGLVVTIFQTPNQKYYLHGYFG